MGLEMMVTEIVTAAGMVEASVAATRKVLHEAHDFAFFDVDLTNGKSLSLHYNRRFTGRSVRDVIGG